MTVHDAREIAAVVEVLESSTQMGPRTAEFERRVAATYSKRHGISVNSGSSALYLAMEALDLPSGSEVITPALTFATTIGSIVKSGLKPVFVDVGADTFVADADRVEDLIGPDTSALVIPNLLGNLPEWDKLRDLADAHDLVVVEDSADIIGARYHGEPIGTYSDVTTASFYGMHVINCAGNGGMVCVNDGDLADRIRVLRSWGRSSTLLVDSEDIDARLAIDVDGIPYDAKFVFEAIGYNLEGSEIGAAFGLVQLDKLPEALDVRRRMCEAQEQFFGRYTEWIDLPRFSPGVDSVWFAFPLVVREEAPFSRRELQTFLEKRNIQTRAVLTGNITRQPGFRGIAMRIDPAGLANTDRIMERGVLVAAHHGLTDRMLAHLHDSFERFARRY
jgi:CDP-6-deoxy-D-xylo-4-hexulose-3-dehydrase